MTEFSLINVFLSFYLSTNLLSMCEGKKDLIRAISNNIFDLSNLRLAFFFVIGRILVLI